MNALTIFASLRKLAGAAAALAMVSAATPALANSSAATDISAPIRATQGDKPSGTVGDEEFGKLFASWGSAAKPSFAAAATTTATVAAPFGMARTFGAVSIPSRNPVESARLTSAYGMRDHPVLGGRRGHKGIDLAGPVGTPIHASADGIVEKAEWFSSYGLFVSIEHGGSIETRYGHMSRLNVAAGQRVRKGDVIGFMGSTGRSTGSHLHYEVRISGEAVNPIPYMQGSAGTVHLARAN